jgi:hypothetical protein
MAKKLSETEQNFRKWLARFRFDGTNVDPFVFLASEEAADDHLRTLWKDARRRCKKYGWKLKKE